MKLMVKGIFPILFLMNLSFSCFAAIATPSTIAKDKTKKESVFKQLSTEEIFTMPRKDIEAKIGRKLKFKEKLGLRIVQKAVKKAGKKRTKELQNENLMGILSMVFGSLGILTFITFYGGILFGIAGIALGVIGLRREEPKRVLSILGIVFGILGFLASLSLFIALLVILGIF